MTAALVNSHVLIDVATDDPTWAGWSSEIVVGMGAEKPLVINPLIWGEVSIASDRIEELEEAVPASAFRREALPWEAGFLTGSEGSKWCARSSPQSRERSLPRRASRLDAFRRSVDQRRFGPGYATAAPGRAYWCATSRAA